MRVPATGEGISVSTLSVETSRSGSSTLTWSPSDFNQRVTVPSLTLSPSAGIVTENVIIFSLVIRVREAVCLQEPYELRPLPQTVLGVHESGMQHRLHVLPS